MVRMVNFMLCRFCHNFFLKINTQREPYKLTIFCNKGSLSELNPSLLNFVLKSFRSLGLEVYHWVTFSPGPWPLPALLLGRTFKNKIDGISPSSKDPPRGHCCLRSRAQCLHKVKTLWLSCSWSASDPSCPLLSCFLWTYSHYLKFPSFSSHR